MATIRTIKTPISLSDSTIKTPLRGLIVIANWEEGLLIVNGGGPPLAGGRSTTAAMGIDAVVAGQEAGGRPARARPNGKEEPGRRDGCC